MIENWKDIKEYEGYYQISDIGRVKSLSRKIRFIHPSSLENCFRVSKERVLKINTSKNGYKYINLHHPETGTSTFSIHRLVAINFLDNDSNKPCVNHIDGIKTNNTTDNLEWCTYKQNSVHASLNNLIKKGEVHYKSTLSNADISDIRKSKMSVPALAKHYGVEYRSMWQIVKGITR